jgi:hypothetical protein
VGGDGRNAFRPRSGIAAGVCAEETEQQRETEKAKRAEAACAKDQPMLGSDTFDEDQAFAGNPAKGLLAGLFNLADFVAAGHRGALAKAIESRVVRAPIVDRDDGGHLIRKLVAGSQ